MEDWLVFPLRDVASGCRCTVEGVGMVVFSCLDVMPRCGLDDTNFIFFLGAFGAVWRVGWLRDVASGCRCNVEGLQNMLALQGNLKGFQVTRRKRIQI